VPVVVFDGTLEQARTRAIEATMEDAMPMRKYERFEVAWTAVGEKKASKREIVVQTGVANATVGEMRKKLAELEQADVDLLTLDWPQAQRWRKQGDGFNVEEWIDKKKNDIKEKLIRSAPWRICSRTHAWCWRSYKTTTRRCCRV
jgi:hypothetical protein